MSADETSSLFSVFRDLEISEAWTAPTAPATLAVRMPQSPDSPRQSQKGFLNPRVVIAVAFWITTTCIVVAVVASILAIWQFTGTDALWRTVATCAVIGAATLAFSFVNGLFVLRDD
jgi:hypothetical protein